MNVVYGEEEVRCKMAIVQCMNYELVVLGDQHKLLRDLQYAVWKTMNRAIQMTWDFQNFQYSYKQRFGDSLKFSDLGTGKKSQASDIYQFVKDEFSYAPSDVLGSAIREAQAGFKALNKAILNGQASIPSFKRDCPIPIRAKMIKISKNNGKYTTEITLRSQPHAKETGVPTREEFRLKAKGSAKPIIDRVMSGEYKMADSKIIKRKNKWCLQLAYKFEPEEVKLDKSNVMGVDLGVINAAVLAFNNEKTRYFIEGNEIRSFRARVEARRNALLRQGKYCGDGRKGHGRKTRLKPIEKLRGKVENFKNTTNHRYAKYIVDIAIKNDCGVIQMEDLTGITKDAGKFLKSWTYYDLQKKIEQKAKVAGIEVRKINPQYTSQRCSRCGCIDENNRKNQAEFKCVTCGYSTNADYNAARNIAIPGIDEIIAKQIEFKRKVAQES
jgi:putative transposase